MSLAPELLTAAWREAVDLCLDRICLVEPAGWRIVYANPAWIGWLGGDGAAVIGKSLFDCLPELRPAPGDDRLQQVAEGTAAEAAIHIHLASGRHTDRPAELCARRVAGPDGVLLVIAIRTAADAAVDCRHRKGRTDPLTGLADRACFLDRLARLLDGDRAGDGCCAVLFVDIDGFKQVNDAWGHLVGDQVLCEVARRLAASVRADDALARFGGDEFVVLLEGVRDREETEPVIGRIRAAFARPVALPQGEAMLTVSIGVADTDCDGGSAVELIHAADRAMYAAKRAGSAAR